MFLRFQPKKATTDHKSYQMEYKTWYEAARQDISCIYDDSQIDSMTNQEVEATWEENYDCHHFAHAGVSCFDADDRYFGLDGYDALVDYVFSDGAYSNYIDSDKWEIIEFSGFQTEEGYDGECIAEIHEIECRYSMREFIAEYNIDIQNPHFESWKEDIL